MTEAPKAYSYLRFSTPEQMAGDSFRRQTALAEDYAQRNGLVIDTSVTYHDLGVSAFRGRNAEAGRLAEFLEAVRVGLVAPGSFLLVESLDRISRQYARKALRVLEEICDEGITVVTLTDNRVYTREALNSDPTALLMSLLVFMRANEESAMKARRLRAAWQGKRLRAQDTPLTAKGPSWLTLDKQKGTWKVNRSRAAVVRRIFKLAAKGVGTHSIVETLNTEGVPVFGPGKQWHRSFISRLLSSPSVIGIHIPHTLEYVDGKRTRVPQEPLPGYFPAIIDEALWHRVRALQDTRGAPQRGSEQRVTNIFGGILRCSRCSGSMTIVHKGKNGGLVKVVCSTAKAGAGCSYESVPYGQLEDAFREAAEALLSAVPLPGVPTQRGDDIASLEAAEGALVDKQQALLGAYESTRSPAILARLAEIDADLKATRESLQALAAHAAANSGPLVESRVEKLREALGAEEMDRRQVNACIRTTFERVVVNPSEGTAEVFWRHGGEPSGFTWGFPTEAAA